MRGAIGVHIRTVKVEVLREEDERTSHVGGSVENGGHNIDDNRSGCDAEEGG